MQVTMGPDGFLATKEVPDYTAHVMLSDYLRERQAAGGAALESALPRLRKELSKRELVALIRAIHARIAWIASEERADEMKATAKDFATLTLDERGLCDLELLAVGGFSPLKSFMHRFDAVIGLGLIAAGAYFVWSRFKVYKQYKLEAAVPSKAD